MRRVSPAKTAIAAGVVIALWHLIWVTLVGVGWARRVLDFVLQLHFINLQYSLAPYSVTTAATLIALTFVVGAFFGLIFAVVWNWLTFEAAPDRERVATATARASMPSGGS